jgi:hypothetical protein
MSKHLNKARATTITRLSQVGFVVLACGAAAMAYVGLPLAQPPMDQDFTVKDSEPVQVPSARTAAQVDISGSAARLARVANAPRPLPPPEPVDTNKEPAPAPAAGPSNIKYLGLARVGAMNMALLAVNAKQRFVREGQIVDSERVVAIKPDHIILSREGTEREVPLEEATGERVTRLRGGGGVPSPVQAGLASISSAERGRPPGGVKGLSRPPKEYHSWHPAYQRLFDRRVNDLAQGGGFDDEAALVEKAKSYLEAEGYRPDDKDGLAKLEEMEKMDREMGEKSPEKREK